MYGLVHEGWNRKTLLKLFEKSNKMNVCKTKLMLKVSLKINKQKKKKHFILIFIFIVSIEQFLQIISLRPTPGFRPLIQISIA